MYPAERRIYEPEVLLFLYIYYLWFPIIQMTPNCYNTRYKAIKTIKQQSVRAGDTRPLFGFQNRHLKHPNPVIAGFRYT